MSSSERLRYATYAIMATLALTAYFWLGAEPDQPTQVAVRKPPQSEELPAIRFLESRGFQGARRDLFAFVQHRKSEEPAILAVPEFLNAERRNSSLLSNLDVIGLVRRSDAVTILLRLDTTLITVRLGERFGTGDALSVQSIEGRNVLIVDSATRTSRIFTLSEE